MTDKDAERYRWLRDLKPNSYTLSYNDGHKPNYMTAEEWLDTCKYMYQHVSKETREKMIANDSIWTLQVYPNTPIGFNWYHGATMDEAIDAAMTDWEERSEELLRECSRFMVDMHILKPEDTCADSVKLKETIDKHLGEMKP